MDHQTVGDTSYTTQGRMILFTESKVSNDVQQPWDLETRFSFTLMASQRLRLSQSFVNAGKRKC